MNEHYISVPLSRMRRVGTLADLVVGMPAKDPRYALFLGAGASRSSGIPTAIDLIGWWKRRLFLGEKRLGSWRHRFQTSFEMWKQDAYPKWKDEWQRTNGRHPGDYSLLFSYVYPDTGARQGFVERICSGAEPGPGYIYLAALVLSGYFQTFLTTNFDDLIHDTLFRYAGLKPMVSAFDSQALSLRAQSPRPKIMKLHGDFLYNNIRNVGAEVSRLDRNIEEKFERTCETYGLIVIGYGGQDQSVMAPLRAMLDKQDRLTHGLHWCFYRDPAAAADGETIQVPEELYRMWESHSGKVHFYDVGSFDEVMETFFIEGHCSPPPDLARPEEKALYARLRDGLENADQTWRLAPYFSNLLAQFQEASTRKPPPSLTLLDFADQKHREGTIQVKERNFQGAFKSFEMAISAATEALGEATPGQRVRAFRRRSGSKSGAAEAVLKETGSTQASELVPTTLELFLSLAKGSVDDARKGLENDQEFGAPAELRGHRRNLWFNGLVGIAYLWFGNEGLADAAKNEALVWFESLSGDVMFGDEYTGLLKQEIGGERLIEILHDFDEAAFDWKPAGKVQFDKVTMNG